MCMSTQIKIHTNYNTESTKPNSADNNSMN